MAQNPVKRSSVKLPKNQNHHEEEEFVFPISKKKLGIFFILSKWFLILSVVCFAAVHAARFILQVEDAVIEKVGMYRENVLSAIVETKIIQEFAPTETAPIHELVLKVSKELGLHPIVLQAIVLKESAGGNNKNYLYRFEPGVFMNRQNADKKYPEGERRMRASSHGITQVMGYVSEDSCGLHWSDLYDNYFALRCAGEILKSNLARASNIKNPSQRLRTAYRMYNGSGPMAEAYATSMMGKIGDLLFDKLSIESGLATKPEEKKK